MNFYIIPGALIITLVLTLLVSLFFKRPLGGLWIFFFIVFMASWAGQLWITPFGPVYGGIAWIPMFTISIFFWILILALIPPLPEPKPGSASTEEKVALTTISVFYWIMLILLIIAIAVGYYRIP